MTIKWRNLLMLILVIIASILLSRYHLPLLTFVISVEKIGPGSTNEEKTLGLFAMLLLGLLLVTMVHILRLVFSNNNSH